MKSEAVFNENLNALNDDEINLIFSSDSSPVLNVETGMSMAVAFGFTTVKSLTHLPTASRLCLHFFLQHALGCNFINQSGKIVSICMWCLHFSFQFDSGDMYSHHESINNCFVFSGGCIVPEKKISCFKS